MAKKKSYKTQLIRGGLSRSNFNETSESLFLTSSFVYDSAEEAELCFKEKKKNSCILDLEIQQLKYFKKN